MAIAFRPSSDLAHLTNSFPAASPYLSVLYVLNILPGSTGLFLKNSFAVGVAAGAKIPGDLPALIGFAIT
jgi:hypothetical protein